MASEAILVEASGREVRITSPDKVFFPSRGETKLDLVHYYQSLEQPVLAALGGRPTLMQRFPDGADGKSFFQKRVGAGAPGWLEQTEVLTPNGTPSNALVIADLAHLLWAVNMGCLGFHPWPFKAAEPQITDELRIDLDPGPGVTFEVHGLWDEGVVEGPAAGDVGGPGSVRASGAAGVAQAPLVLPGTVVRHGHVHRSAAGVGRRLRWGGEGVEHVVVWGPVLSGACQNDRIYSDKLP